MDCWTNALEYEANIAFLRGRKHIYLVSTFGYDPGNQNTRQETYRGIFNSGKYQITVNFTAFSDGRAEAHIIDFLNHNHFEPAYPVIKKPVITSEKSMVETYKAMMDSIRDTTGAGISTTDGAVMYDQTRGRISAFRLNCKKG